MSSEMTSSEAVKTDGNVFVSAYCVFNYCLSKEFSPHSAVAQWRSSTHSIHQFIVTAGGPTAFSSMLLLGRRKLKLTTNLYFTMDIF